MEKIKKEKGITLITLVITIIVMLIIAGISISSGTDSIDKTRLKSFYTELEIVQKRVDSIAITNESYIDSNGNVVYIKNMGSNLTLDQDNFITNINANLVPSEFRYFTIEDVNRYLEIPEVKQNIFINFDKRIIISEQGIEANNQMYYMLPNNTYFVEYNSQKNVGDIDFNCTISKYNLDKYQIIIILNNNIGDLNGTGIVKYKDSDSKYWNSTNNLKIIIEELSDYDIMYEDINKNQIQKKFRVNLDNELNPVITEIIS